VTELVDCVPDEIGIAADLLGHADLRTTTRHYIKAKGMTAHRRVQETIAARRRAATSRDSTATSLLDAAIGR
jgi:integrase